MNNIYDVFLEQSSIKKKKCFEDIQFGPLHVNKRSKSWKFYITLNEPVSLADYKYLYETFNTFFMKKPVERINLEITYLSHDVSKINMVEYFEYVLDALIEQKGSYKILKQCEVVFENDTFTVKTAPNMKGIHSVVDSVMEGLLHLGFDMTYEFSVSEDMKTTEQKMNERLEEEKKNYEQISQEAAANQKEVKIEQVKEKYDKETKTTKISEIPIDQLALDKYVRTVGSSKFYISGEIIRIEIRALQKSTLLSVDVYDGTDSITCTQFLRKEEQIADAKKLKKGDILSIFGEASYDMYQRDITMKVIKLEFVEHKKKEEISDFALEKRVELHCHTKMSNADGLAEPAELIDQAIKWGHPGIAFTDKNGVYAYHDIWVASEKLKDFKVIYGTEYDYIDDENKLKCTFFENNFKLEDETYVVYDLETTGFSILEQKILEVGAIKIRHGEIVDSFSEFINPEREISQKITELTSITQAMVKDARSTKEVLSDFAKFFEGSCLVGHNVNFDNGFLFYNLKKENIPYHYIGVIDTLPIARGYYFDIMKRFNLKDMSKAFKVKLDAHHRAVNDSKATADCFLCMLRDFKKKGIVNYKDIDACVNKDEMWKSMIPNHANLLALNETGYRNLFIIISEAMTKHVSKGPRMFRSDVEKHHEGVLIGSSCYHGEVFEAAMNKTYEDLLNVMQFYDYVEVQPPVGYAQFEEDFLNPTKAIQDIIQRIIDAAHELGKIVVATSDCHYLSKADEPYYEILTNIKQVGGVIHDLKRYNKLPDRHFFTTDEMLKEFSFLPQDIRSEIVVKNPNKILNMAERIVAFKPELYSPQDDFMSDFGIPSVEEDLKRMVNENVHNLYGDPLPKLVEDRLNKELHSIISNGFSSTYYISHLLVHKSHTDGYVVGSRGSVGSSLVATMMEITEVNPLPPHYRCPKCKFSSFKMNPEALEKYGVRDIEKGCQEELNKVESGFDLPDMNCPVCNEPLKKDGHDIPFETFLGFNGDKTPDIDLNFSGDYQATAHLYVREIMGMERAFRSGTIGTIAENTAFGHIKNYLSEHGIQKRKAEISRMASHLVGIRRTTGQHPGGIIVVPKNKEIYDVTPIQYPADDNTFPWRTTHFEYHSFQDNLLKLDILGHDDPTVLKYLMDYVNEHQDQFPFSTPYDIPVDDKKIYDLFHATEVLGVTPEQIDSKVGSYAVPEFGTNFVRGMLVETRPNSFAELVKLSGLSHGTDVWNNNARELVNGRVEGFPTINIKDIIGCRDDIMVDLMAMGVEPKKAFDIMEFVRKGKPTKDPLKWQDHKKYLEEHNVPAWYIWSCSKIQYMFPKAHATAYVLNAMRIAWFKIHAPILFYSAYFTIRAPYFDLESMLAGPTALKQKIAQLKGTGVFDEEDDDDSDEEQTDGAKKKDSDLATVLQVALEMWQRGFSFKNVDVTRSEAKKFVIDGDSLIMPFVTIPGLGDNAAFDAVERRKEHPFTSKEDVVNRTKLNKTVIDKMVELGCMDMLPDEEEREQGIDLFNIED